MIIKGERVVFSERNKYRVISLQNNGYIMDWLKILFEGYYPDLASDICFESVDVYVTTMMQDDDSLLMKTKYKACDVMFLLVDFSAVNGMRDAEFIQMLLYQWKLIKTDYKIPVIPCVIFQTERDYDVVLSLLTQVPYELALVINYLSFVYEE